MIVACKGCGHRYQVDTSQFDGNKISFTCNTCNEIVLVRRPRGEKKKAEGPKTAKAAGPKASKRRGIGLKGKIFVLFFFVPISLIIAAGYLFVDQLNGMSSLISDESSQMVTKMAEEIIFNKGIAVAREVKLYLDTHPDLKKEDFNKTPEFKKIAMQKVGKTGYTLLVERRTATKRKEIMWVHPVDKLVGIDMEPALKKKLGDKWARWDKIRSKDVITKGYYLWFDNREKYCANIPMLGTPFNIVSSTYIDEFTQPVKDLRANMGRITDSTLKIVITIIALTAILIGIITIFYGKKLTTKISRLTNVADRISTGDMDVQIDDSGKDELGDLAQSISRMQHSIRLAMDKLRRSRSRAA
jgi:HAMP domain-containing protein